MKKLIALFIITGCTGHGQHAAASEGVGYMQSFHSAIFAHTYASRDLTDEEMDEADNLPGGGYSNGSWTGQNPPNGENEDGDPAYVNPEHDYSVNLPEWDDLPEDWEPVRENPEYIAIQFFEDEDGNVWVLDDDGEIIEIPA